MKLIISNKMDEVVKMQHDYFSLSWQQKMLNTRFKLTKENNNQKIKTQTKINSRNS